MSKRTTCLVQRVVVLVLCFLVAQSFHYGETVNTETSPPVVKLRLSFELKKARQVVFSPVSKLLAVQREDGSVNIVDTTDGREQSVLPLADKIWYYMRWTNDGLRLMLVDKKSAGLWDARRGIRVSPPIEVRLHKFFMLFDQVALSPDEQLLLNVKQDESFKATAFGMEKATAQVWNLESGQVRYEIQINGAGARAQWNPNGKQILTTSAKEDAKLWNVETGRLFATLQPTRSALFDYGSYAEFSPDGKFVVQTDAGSIYIWHTSSGALNTSVPFDDHHGRRSLKGFSPDGKMFATVQQTSGWRVLTSIELRDCSTGELRSTLTAKKWGDWPDQLLWSNDGRTVLAASGRKYQGRIWDVGTGALKATFPMVLTYSRFPLNFGFKDQDDLNLHPTLPVVSAASNKFVRLWNMDTGELMQELADTGWPAEWSADGKLFLTFAKDLKIVHVWDVVGSKNESRKRFAIAAVHRGNNKGHQAR